jgi:NAD(P)-dependent dehydrogenase (short-subunit alcohol dehydrogenase family)
MGLRVDVALSDRTVMIAAAGCDAGRCLAQTCAQAGARVIALEREANRARAVARARPDRIETLALDTLRPEHCQRLGMIWSDTPLDLLLHLQPIRAPRRPGAAIAAIPALSRALLRGLGAGAGRVIVVFRAPAPGAGPEDLAYDAGMCALAGHMQEEVGGRAMVNALRLAPEGAERSCGARLWPAVAMLTAGNWAGPCGSVLHLGPE